MINWIVLSTSSMLATLTVVCIYLVGTDKTPVGIPSLVRCIAVPSVVPPSLTSSWYGISSSSPVLHKRSLIIFGEIIPLQLASITITAGPLHITTGDSSGLIHGWSPD